MHRRLILIVLLLFALPACAQIGLPEVTPTVAPTRTATPTAERTIVAQLATRTPFPTATNTEAPPVTVPPSESPTPSATSSQTATATPTVTPTVTSSPTATRTDAPSATPTPTPSTTFTPTATVTPSVTNLPRIAPTDTPSPTPTDTLTPTTTSTLTPAPTATDTFTPPPTATFTAPPPTDTFTPAPTATATSTLTPEPTPTVTLSPTRTLPPTWTPLPQPTSTSTLAPTLDATPTFVTAAPETPVPPDLAQTITPVVGDSPAEAFVPTFTPSPAPTVANVAPPPTLSLSDLPQVAPPDISARAFALGPAGQGGVSFNLGVSNPTLFVQNPRDPDAFLATDSIGLLYTVDGGLPSGLGMSPFSGLETSREDNNAIVVDAAWSPDGRSIAFVVDADRTENDGVWWYTPGATAPVQILVDCLPSGCITVQRDSPPYEYETRSVVWSPQSNAVLAQVYWYERQRYAQIILEPSGSQEYRSVRPPVFEYDYGDWSVDGQRLIVSGRDDSGRVVLGSINRYAGNDRNARDERIALDGSALGLWIQHGVQRPNGSLLALGRYGDANGPQHIIDQSGALLTDPIGGAAPRVVRWSPDRSQVYVENADGRKYIAGIDGRIEDITDRVGGVQAVAWVGGRLPPSAESGGAGSVPSDFIPSGVIEGQRFQPGQQVIVSSATGQLNLRASPELAEGNIVGGVTNGEYVAILAGPRITGGIEWWQVQLVSGQRAWIAAVIDGVPVLLP